MNTAYRYLHLILPDCPVPPGTLVIGYGRDSGGDEQDESVDQQREVYEEYTRFHGLLTGTFYIDEARTSSTTEHRNGLAELQAFIAARCPLIASAKKRDLVLARPSVALVCWKFNRVVRDVPMAQLLRAELMVRGVPVIELAGEKGTGNRVVDSFMHTLNDIKDADLLRQISEDAKRALARNVSLRDTDAHFQQYNPTWPTHDGRYLGVAPGRPPVGFKGESIQVGVRERKRGKTVSREPHLVQRWVPDQAAWRRCHLAWEMRREGQSVLAIHQATRLFPSLNSYATFFTNRIYTGDFNYGGQCYMDFVPALIAREWFTEEQQCIAERAQKMQGRDTQPMVEPRRKSSPGLLSGKVFCGSVAGEEHPMHWHSAPARAGHAQWDSYHCSCRKRTHGERCRGQDVSARALHQAVLDKIFSDILTRDNLRPLADELTQALHAQNATVSIQRQVIEDQLAKNQQALTRLLDSLEQNDLPRPLVAERLTQRYAERSELLSQLQRLDEQAVKPAVLPTITDELIDDYIDKVRHALHGQDVALARRILNHFIAKIVLRGKTGTIYYTFPLADLPPERTFSPEGFRVGKIVTQGGLCNSPDHTAAGLKQP